MKLLRTAAALLTFVVPLAAQDSTASAEPAVPWRTSYFPYFTVSPNEGLMGIARVLVFRQANYDDRVSLRDAVALEGGYSTKDAWLLRGRVDMPMIADGWRLAASVETGKQPHFGFPDSGVVRSRTGGWVDVTRRLDKGPIQFALRGGVDHQHITGDAALYRRYPITAFESATCLPQAQCFNGSEFHIRQTDVSARAALVLDYRDREFDTRNGALIEGGFFVGTGGDRSYYGAYTMARGWWMPRRGTRLTARVAAIDVSETDAVGILNEIPAWESPVTTFGGPMSHRGLGIAERSGRGGFLAGAELRHDLLNVGEIGAITALAFVDLLKPYREQSSPLVDPAPGMRLPPSAYVAKQLGPGTIGAGGGIAIRVLRSAQLTITAARGAGVTRWYVSSGWSW